MEKIIWKFLVAIRESKFKFIYVIMLMMLKSVLNCLSFWEKLKNPWNLSIAKELGRMKF